ncbi:MAG TPA: group 1 truncated hemoglobin [Acetobacteraceae bacterium]|nr:group 1 truncated hemoglobin [Acetobacteraceae bacterium]
MSMSAGAPPPDAQPLFVRLSGEAGIGQILDVQFEHIMADDHLREYFLDVDLPHLKASLSIFLRVAFGDTRAAYAGPTLHAAHKGQLVTELAFDTFVDSFVAAAAETGVDANSQAAARAVLKSMRASVITEFKPNPAYNYPTQPR